MVVVVVNDHTTVVMDDGTRAEMLQPAGEVVATLHLLVVGAAMDYGR